MSMPIQRQSEAFGIFDDGPRFARDRASHDLPRGLAGLLNSTGPRITAGLLNTRQASCDYRESARLAVNTDGMDPDSHAYGRQPYDPLFGEFGHDGYDYEGVSRGEFNHRMRDRDVERESQDAREDEDDDTGYNWGPVPPEHLGSRLPFDRAAAARLAACQECGEDIYPDEGWYHLNGYPDEYDHDAEPHDDDIANDEYGLHLDPARGMDRYKQLREMEIRRLAKDDGKCTCWEGYERVPGTEPCASKSCRKKTSARVALAPAPVDPAAAQMPMGGGLLPAHRVGLDWRDRTVPGTVIGVDPSQVHIRWDDGQYTSEEPNEVHLL